MHCRVQRFEIEVGVKLREHAGLGFRAWVVGLRVQGLGFLSLRIQGIDLLGFRDRVHVKALMKDYGLP